MNRAVVVAALLLGCNGLGLAQETTGQIRGGLYSAAGPIADARITATSENMLGMHRAVSASDGVFLLLALPPGSYTLRIIAIGHRPLVVREVQVALGRVTGLGDVEMEATAVELSEITITAPRLTLDPVNTTIGATLEAADLAALPGERDYKSLITILPHVNTSYHGDPANSAGATGLENMYFIDGVNVTAPWRAATGTSLPYNFVRSVEVRSGGYEAQYGRALGAVVNAVTYTGSNQFQANVFAFMTHSGLSATPKLQPTLRETGAYSYDVGARISGPVVGDRLWFSAAYNPRISHADREIAGLGTYADRSRADIFAGKLTWQPVSGANVELSVFGDPTIHHAVGGEAYDPGLTPLSPDGLLHRLETGGVSVSLRASAMVGGSLLIEASAARSNSSDSDLPETAGGSSEIGVIDYVKGTSEGGFGPTDVTQRTTEATLRGTLSAGRHRVVVGAEYENSRVTEDYWSDFIVRTDSNQYDLHREGTRATVHNLVPTAYLQDSWRVTDRLTLNAGVRWSTQFFKGASGSTAERLGNEWQPRLGFSWELDPRATQRIFGSYGRFYQQEPLFLSLLYYVDFLQKDWFYASDPRQPGAVPLDSADYSNREAAYARSAAGSTGERYDEWTLGYERLVGSWARLAVRGIHRHLGTTFQQGFDISRAPYWFLGTPGQGNLAFLPQAHRDYTALELTFEGSGRRLQYRASYVLSRAWGNYTGLYSSDLYRGQPGVDFGLSTPEQAKNSTGLLPNDRPHVLKLTATYALTQGLTAGGILVWQSGTPLNEFGAGSFIPVFQTFLAPRGSVGRTPALWDLNLRLAYTTTLAGGAQTRAVLDLLQVGNPRRAVRLDQQHYRNSDRTTVNQNYLQATAFQPPMAARLGLEVTF